MISLDEDYIGTDPTTIIVRGLKVCGGLIVRLTNNTLLGAHWTPGSTPAEILTACTYMVNHWKGGVATQNMYFICSQAAWLGRRDKYANPTTLVTDLKAMLNFNGQLWYFDKDSLGTSVDLRCDNPTAMSWRVTPSPDPLVVTPSVFVKVARQRVGAAVPTVVNTGPPRFHQLPQSTAPFTPFQMGQMIPV